jgi:hypothetical protein
MITPIRLNIARGIPHTIVTIQKPTTAQYAPGILLLETIVVLLIIMPKKYVCPVAKASRTIKMPFIQIPNMMKLEITIKIRTGVVGYSESNFGFLI